MNVQSFTKACRRQHSDFLSKLPSQRAAKLTRVNDLWSCAMGLVLACFGESIERLRRTLKQPVTLDAEVEIHRDGFSYNRDDSFSLVLDDGTRIQVCGDDESDKAIAELTGGVHDGDSMYDELHELVDTLPYWRWAELDGLRLEPLPAEVTKKRTRAVQP